jgi:hypothetical protein
MRPGITFEWRGTAYQEVAASGQTGAILGLAVLFSSFADCPPDLRRWTMKDQFSP